MRARNHLYTANGINYPTKAVRVALENAGGVSVTSVLMLTEATMKEVEELSPNGHPAAIEPPLEYLNIILH